MKTKRFFPLYILILLSITILYVLLAVKPLGKEYQFSPVWRINTSNPTIGQVPENAKKMYFRLNHTMGYFTENGDISLYKSYPQKVSISDNYFSIYSNNAVDTILYDNNGQNLGTLEAAGFPYYKNNIIYVMLPGGASFGKCDNSGKVTWKYEGTVPITAFSPKEKFTAVGFANGYIKVFDTKTGALQLTYAPGGSDFPVILGVDISEDGEYIASVSGHNQQRFVLAHKEKNQPKIIHHRFVESNSPDRILVHFCQDGKRIIYNYENNVGIYDLLADKTTVIPVEDKVISIQETEDLVYLLSRKNDNYTVSIVEKTNVLEGSFSFQGKGAFIRTEGNNLYVGRNNSISRIAVTKE